MSRSSGATRSSRWAASPWTRRSCRGTGSRETAAGRSSARARARSSFPWLTIRERPELSHFRTWFTEPGGPTTRRRRCGPPRARSSTSPTARAGRALGPGVRVIKQNRGVPDIDPLSLIDDRDDRQRCRPGRQALDSRRFRPNLVIEPIGDEPFPEDGWVGSVLRIGDLRMRIDQRDKRCVMINIDPDTDERDAAVLRTSRRSALREPRPEVRQLGPLADRQPRERAAAQALADERPAAVSLDPVPGHERLVQQLAAHRLDRVAPELGDTPDLHGRKCMLRALSRAPGRPASRRRGNPLRDGRPTRGGESTPRRDMTLGSASPSAHPVGRTPPVHITHARSAPRRHREPAQPCWQGSLGASRCSRWRLPAAAPVRRQRRRLAERHAVGAGHPRARGRPAAAAPRSTSAGGSAPRPICR